ncbi:aminopeptidase Ey isoform X2 [Hydra vulgaris]|uniref:Aminopeptidase n=1 Tax=Hydra vulgaris TaxID=6087 RepID=A0ABM4DJH4_HYDVU
MSVSFTDSRTKLHIDDDIVKKRITTKDKIIFGAIFAVLLITIIILGFILYETKQNLNKALKSGQVSGTPTEVVKTTAETVSTTQNVPISTGNESYSNIRLPSNIIPSSYDIFLDVDMFTDQVNGQCNITVEVKSPTDYVIIHAYKYDFFTAKIMSENKAIVQKRTFFFEKNQYHVMELGEKLTKGKYILYYEFKYKLRDNLKGFYKSSYKRNDGTESPVASTQFQPVDARIAFPCFDEPAFKATFKISLSHSNTFISVSNMPIVRKEDQGGKITNYFDVTPKMPTYLVAFVIGEFSHKTIYAVNSTNKVQMDFYAPKNQIDQVDFSMDVGSKILPYFESFYNVTYPLPKADMIGLPDFAAGAMENWGLMTYRLTALLYDPKESALSNKEYVASVVSHELAHMWFGNIVTNEWWSDLWLNEGFASYVEYLGVAKCFPEWDFLDDQVISDRATALKLDALVTSHPIFIEVNHPDEISEIFDAITYQKGGFILRMLNRFLGDAVFQKGVNIYLNKNLYGNAKTKDLWDALKEASGGIYNISEIMDTWTLQMGFPVVSVKSISGGFEVTQSRFYADRNPELKKSKFNSTYDYKWMIPFSYTVLNKTSGKWTKSEIKTDWLKMNNINLNVGGLLIKGNALQDGFYRVNYDSNGWNNFIEILKSNHTIFDVKDRAGLISDVFAFADSGLVNYTVALDLIGYAGKETEYIPWAAVRDATTSIRSLLQQGGKASNLFKKFLLQKVRNLFDIYGFENVANYKTRHLQVIVAAFACSSGYINCLRNATTLFNNWMNSPSSNNIPADFRNIVYYYGVYNGGEKEWDFLYNQYLTSTVASERTKLFYGMSASQETWLIDRYLHRALNKSIVKDQDFSFVVQYVSNNNAAGRYLAFSFLKEKWGEISERFTKSFFTLKRVFEAITSGFSHEYELEMLQTFVKSIKDQGTAKRIIEQAQEKIRANIEWKRNNEKVIEQWLVDQKLE